MVLLASIPVALKTADGCVLAADCFSLVQASDVLTADTPSGVRPLRAGGVPESITWLSATDGGAVYGTAGRTGALPRQYAPSRPYALVSTERLRCSVG